MGFRRPSSLWTVAAVALTLSAWRPAQGACPSLLTAVVYSPSDGERNVPTNAVIDIHVFGEPIPSDIARQFSLWQRLTMTPISIAFIDRIDSNVPYATAIRLTPCQPCVNPNQEYQVRQGTTFSSPLLATFNTGNAPDTSLSLQPLTGANATVNGFDTHPDGGSDCFTERLRLVRLNVPPVGKPVIYTIKEGGQIISARDSSLTGSFYCTGQPHWQGDTSWIVAPGPHTLQLSAVDRAGHESAAVDVSFNASCDGGSPDAGPPGGGSGSAGDGSRPVQPASCSCGTGVSAALALGALAAALKRQRRRDRPPTT